MPEQKSFLMRFVYALRRVAFGAVILLGGGLVFSIRSTEAVMSWEEVLALNVVFWFFLAFLAALRFSKPQAKKKN